MILFSSSILELDNEKLIIKSCHQDLNNSGEKGESRWLANPLSSLGKSMKGGEEK